MAAPRSARSAVQLDERPGVARWVVRGIFLSLLLVANGIVLSIAAEDRSWGALGMAIVVGPITNGCLALLSLLFTPWIRQLTDSSPRVHAVFSVAAPAVAIVADLVLIGAMDLRGC